MRIQLNGEWREFDQISRLDELVARLALDPSRIAAELNQVIVRKSEYATTQIKDGDSLEIVTFVGGG